MVIVVANIADGTHTNAQGAALRDALLDALRHHDHVTLDFFGLGNVTSSFVNSSFVEVVEQLGFENFRMSVRIVNVSRQAAFMIKDRVAFAKGLEAA